MSNQTDRQIEIIMVKTLKLLNDKFNIFDDVDITLNGTVYHKRKDRHQDVGKYIFYKYCRKLNITTMDQLNTLINTYLSDMKEININLSKVIDQHRKKAKQITNQTLNNMNTKLKKKFKNITLSREQHIKKYGLKVNLMETQEYDKYVFVPTKYGFIDYYNGVILLTDLNINNLYNVFMKEPKRTYTTDEYGYLKVFVILNGVKYIKYYDFRHPNTKFNFWHKVTPDKKELTRLYYNNGQKIIIDKLKMGVIIKSNYF
jgi:hypothetical protein